MSNVKLSSKAIDALLAAGEVKAGVFRIALADLESFRPTRTRTTEDDRTEAFSKVLEAAGTPPDETGVITLSVAALEDAGLPAGSVANQTYWSGIAPGSQLAHAAGFTSKLTSRKMPGGVYSMEVVLTPATPAQQAKHAEGLAKAEEKAKKIKADKEAAEAAAKLAAANTAANTEGATATTEGGDATATDAPATEVVEDLIEEPSEETPAVVEPVEPVAAPAKPGRRR